MINLSKNEDDNFFIREEENPLDPKPDAITEDGKKMWIIKDYRIWAQTYQQALKLLPLIESF